jgi:hypothetical protein
VAEVGDWDWVEQPDMVTRTARIMVRERRSSREVSMVVALSVGWRFHYVGRFGEGQGLISLGLMQVGNSSSRNLYSSDRMLRPISSSAITQSHSEPRNWSPRPKVIQICSSPFSINMPHGISLCMPGWFQSPNHRMSQSLRAGFENKCRILLMITYRIGGMYRIIM